MERPLFWISQREQQFGCWILWIALWIFCRLLINTLKWNLNHKFQQNVTSFVVTRTYLNSPSAEFNPPLVHKKVCGRKSYPSSYSKLSNLIKEAEKIILTIIHERIFQLRTRKSDGSEILEHKPRGSSVNQISQTQVSRPVQERQNIRAWFFHGEENGSTFPLGIATQHGDDEVCWERIQVYCGLIK